ncbi:IS110 family transposase [Ktedonospora formicarum]|uniref:IS110 family transposase n=1 Tax=Ktedonospora formicarum TaxID=2778364 RepID=UPI0027DB6DF7|nr:transposase [Ktedonospora formicarum]
MSHMLLKIVILVPLLMSSKQIFPCLRVFKSPIGHTPLHIEYCFYIILIRFALESTGVYWHPVYNILEDGRTVILVNPQHMKAVPGRKTDIKDSEWLAELLRHGLLQASFIPPKPIRELRDLTRYRKSLVSERTQEVNRLQKLLEGANIKLASVVTDVLGKSG